MGNLLQRPVLKKKTSFGKNEDKNISFGCSSMQGYRITDEDKISYIIDKSIGSNKISFFAVFDGHSGSGAAKFCSSHLSECIFDQENIFSNIFSNEAITKAFLKCDSDFKNSSTDEKGRDNGRYDGRDDDPGTTCIAILCHSYTETIKEKEQHKIKITCLNLGDSRCVAYDCNIDKDEDKVIAMSKDHKPNNETEQNRIIKSGSWVENNRVNGQLALSRAFGDFSYKNKKKLKEIEQAVIALPDIERYEFSIGEKDKYSYQFIVLACDGIWDVMSNEEVCTFVKKRLKEQDDVVYYKNREERFYKLQTKNSYLKPEIIEEKKGYDLDTICSELLNYCVLEKNSKDNCSAIIVLLSS
uniref:protein-serine/threonine phosphatase n=1 Tax=Mimivirus LCMiAC01 TaxID=2506608 RepID=A0A481Z1Q0_9VIRU|nr:MAG: protein phosphatase 2C [Mimivirus LCMiAC01]